VCAHASKNRPLTRTKKPGDLSRKSLSISVKDARGNLVTRSGSFGHQGSQGRKGGGSQPPPVDVGVDILRPGAPYYLCQRGGRGRRGPSFP
jgi:hypothetical protein